MNGQYRIQKKSCVDLNRSIGMCQQASLNLRSSMISRPGVLIQPWRVAAPASTMHLHHHHKKHGADREAVEVLTW